MVRLELRLCSQHTPVLSASLWIIVYLLHSGSSSEEEVPLCVRDLLSLPHDFSTQHEGEHQLVLLKQTPGETQQTTMLNQRVCVLKNTP